MTIWVIFDHPADCPEWYVARKDSVPTEWPAMAYQMVFDRKLSRLRRRFAAEGLACLAPMAGDDPKILEYWL